MSEIDPLMKVRQEKLKALKESGLDPYPSGSYVRSHSALKIHSAFKEGQSEKVKIAGRLMSIRLHGKAAFGHLKDQTGQIQLYIKQDVIGEETFEFFKELDIGDIVGVQGETFRTRRGEVTIQVENLTLLSKSLRPLPEKWHGLKDVEIRYRQRYVDLIVNDEVKEVFLARSKIVSAIREFLDKEGFLEVETPMMQSLAGGATAKPFVTHHNALDMDLYLRIAPELYLKRLVVGGLENVYEINRNFRNEGISIRHNPEFTMLEVYKAYADYTDMMALTQELITYAARKVSGTLSLSYQEKEIDLTPPWAKISVFEAITKFARVSIDSLEEVEEVACKLGLEIEEDWGKGEILDHILDKFVEPKLIQPTFLIDYPTILSPLAKQKIDNPDLVQRFELFICGQEIGNAYTELNDPIEQRRRLTMQDAENVDEDFLRALEYGLAPTGGLGIGIDRLVMLLTDSASIRDVILFPQLRPEGN